MSDAYLPRPTVTTGHPFAPHHGSLATAQAARLAKRLIDLGGALALILATLPVMLALAILIRRDGGPVIFRHTRIGRDGQPFACLKFRTMVMDADARLARLLAEDPAAAEEWAVRRKLPNDPRITAIGRRLRATSLDELPQLFNVLSGEMSLVGPRPVVRSELDQHYGPAAIAAYGAVRPGITGLWQISGRSDTTYVERVSLDTRYVRDWSVLLDLKILLRTIPAVLGRRGAV